MRPQLKWVPFDAEDEVLDSQPFVGSEVRYNLMQLHRYTPDALLLKSPDGRAVLTWMAGWNAWLWLDAELNEEERRSRMNTLAEELDDRAIRLSGVSSDPEDARVFAALYAGRHGLEVEEHMELVAYDCPSVQSPVGVPGRLRQTYAADEPTLAAFLSGFVWDAFGETRSAESFAEDAARMAVSGQVYIWEVEGTPSAMLQLASASKRHCRMNEVYTPPECRKRGYASALVAQLCLKLLGEDLTPMLYADKKNPDSNGVYRKVGFQEAGQILGTRFQGWKVDKQEP
ncbi:hypothetical protein B9G55_09015 [Saccharibacillus sp. O16]|nr:hypothetical protein B9G55_09015 [Saccharibacillus sp. O16]